MSQFGWCMSYIKTLALFVGTKIACCALTVRSMIPKWMANASTLACFHLTKIIIINIDHTSATENVALLMRPQNSIVC